MKTKIDSHYVKPLFGKKAILLSMLPGLLFFVCFRIFPSLCTFLFSFTDIMQVPGREINFVGLDNYRELFFTNNSRDLTLAFERTAIYCVVVTAVQISVALFVAILLNKAFIRGRNLYRTIIFMPTILGVSVVGLCFKLFFSVDGPANWILAHFDKQSAFFGDWNLAFPLVIFCQIWMSVGYTMVIFIAGLQNIPSDLYEAAKIDGANPWKEFTSITIPLLWPTIMVNVMLTVIGSLSNFQMILITTGGAPQAKTLSMYAYQLAFGVGLNGGDANIGRQGFAAAMQMVLFTFILIVTLTSQHFMSKMNKED